MAILQEAKSQFVAKVHGWFDQTVDRVSSRFTVTARIITFVAALIIAVTVQLDTFALVNRLSVDDQFREAVKGGADKVMKDALAANQFGKFQRHIHGFTHADSSCCSYNSREFSNGNASCHGHTHAINPGCKRNQHIAHTHANANTPQTAASAQSRVLHSAFHCRPGHATHGLWHLVGQIDPGKNPRHSAFRFAAEPGRAILVWTPARLVEAALGRRTE